MLLARFRTRCGIGRSHHGIIARQSPLFPEFFGRDVVVTLQVPLEGFELLAGVTDFLTAMAGYISAFWGSTPCMEALLNAA